MDISAGIEEHQPLIEERIAELELMEVGTDDVVAPSPSPPRSDLVAELMAKLAVKDSMLAQKDEELAKKDETIRRLESDYERATKYANDGVSSSSAPTSVRPFE